MYEKNIKHLKAAKMIYNLYISDMKWLLSISGDAITYFWKPTWL